MTTNQPPFVLCCNLRLARALITALPFRSSSVDWLCSEATAPPVCPSSTNVPSSTYILRCPAVFHASHVSTRGTHVAAERYIAQRLSLSPSLSCFARLTSLSLSLPNYTHNRIKLTNRTPNLHAPQLAFASCTRFTLSTPRLRAASKPTWRLSGSSFHYYRPPCYLS